jgi:outer membrane protein TolC
MEQLRYRWAHVLMGLVLHLALIPDVLAQSADADGTFRFGVDQCIAYALKHRKEALTKRIDLEKAQQDVRLYTSSGYPQVNAAGTFSHNLKVQVFPIPASFVGGPAGEFLFVEAAPKNSVSGGITVRQLGFDGTFFIGLKAAKEYVRLAEAEVRLTDANLAAEVSKTYYSVLVSLERIRLLESSIQQIEALYKDTKALVDNGFAEKLDLDRIQVTLTNTQTELDKMRQLIIQNYNLLKFQMGMDIGARLLLTDRLDRSDFNPQLTDTTATVDLRRRAEFRVLEQGIVMQDLAIRREKAGYWPTLYFNANLSTQTFGARADQLLETNRQWFAFSTIGFTLSVPIFNGFRTAALVEKEKLERLKLTHERRQLEQLVSFEVANARTSLQNALRTLESQRRNLELAQEIYRITKIKYDEGVGTNLEVVTADTERNAAQSNYVNALLEAYIARTDLQRALGTLYDPYQTNP